MGSTTHIGQSQSTSKRRLTTIVATDICGYSILSEQSDQLAIDIVDSVFALFQSSVQKHEGRVFKRIADGFLAEFPSAESAIRSAVEFTKAVKENSYRLTTSAEVGIRTGVHVGDVTEREDGDLLGHGVNVAVRLQEEANIGGVLASVNVINLLRQNSHFFKKGRGRTISLKNIKDPIVAYYVAGVDGTLRPVHRRKVAKRIQGGLVIGALLIGGYVIGLGYQKQLESNAQKAVENVIANSFNSSQLAETKTSISSVYIRNVLEKMQASNIRSHKASFALLESGNITDAIEILEGMLANIDIKSDEYVNTLHQVAALSYYHDSAKAVAYYETILEIDPDDATAMIPLVKAYQVRLEADKAYALYDDIVQKKIGSPEEKFRLQLDMAFNHILQQEFEGAIEILSRLKKQTDSLDNRSLLLEWQFLLGYSYVRIGELDKGEYLLVLSVAELRELPGDENLPRAYSALGKLFEIRSDSTEGEPESHLRQALNFYSLQYKAAQAIGKKREIPESLYSMGDVNFRLGDLDMARQNYLDALRLAKSQNYLTSERRARVGLAKLEKLAGGQEAACRQIKKVEQLYKKNPAIKPSAKNVAAMKNIGCSWP